MIPSKKGLFVLQPLEPRIMQMQERPNSLQQAGVSEAEVSKLFRNTYSLLALTLAFSAFVALTSMFMNFPRPTLIITLVGFYGLLFGIHKTRNSGWGLVLTFALTGFMGYTLGPLLNFYLSMPNGGQLVSMALGMTAMVFFGLSAYAIMTRKDFSFLSGFIMAGFIVLLCAVVASFFIQMSGLQLAISAGFVLFSSAVILYQTSAIIHGGEDNYIMATITLFVSIYNLFLSLLQLLGVFSSD